MNLLTSTETLPIILALLVALSAGIVGAFALMKRMALAGDVMSHITLPGLGLALMFDINQIIGGAATLLIGILLIWRLEQKAGFASDAAIGVIFASSLALGALLTPSEELIEALFGGFGPLSIETFVFYAVLTLGIITATLLLRHKLLLSLFSTDIAATSRIKVSALHLVFLLIFGAEIMVGLRFLGALLVGALIIIPAAIAKNLTNKLSSFLIISSAASILSTAIGLAASKMYDFDLGPSVIAAAAGLFVISLFFREKE